jgi:hypothetical protein
MEAGCYSSLSGAGVHRKEPPALVAMNPGYGDERDGYVAQLYGQITVAFLFKKAIISLQSEC